MVALADSVWFVGVAAAFFALGYAARTWESFALRGLLVGIGLALFLFTAAVEFLVVLDDEDWWDDFRAQNRMTVLVPILQFVAVGGGTWLGWSIAG